MGIVRTLLGVLALNALLAATEKFDPSVLLGWITANKIIVAPVLLVSMCWSVFRWAKHYVEFREVVEKAPSFITRDLALLRRLVTAMRNLVRWVRSHRLVLVSTAPVSGGLADGDDASDEQEPDPDPSGGGSGSGGAGSQWRQVPQLRRDGSRVNWKIIDGGRLKGLLGRIFRWLSPAVPTSAPRELPPRRLRTTAAALLAGTILSGVAGHAAQSPVVRGAPPSTGATSVPDGTGTRQTKSLRVFGVQRLEPETVLSFTKLRTGQAYTNETLDQATQDLYASDLFADVNISGAESGDIVLTVRENPVINRVIFEGNKRLKVDKIEKEVKLAPRQIFTRTAVRQDVARILELYRAQGRFATLVEPKIVSLDQNRVDVIFDVTEGYADFRVTSSVVELTPDKKDFIITYVVEEGPRYKFGDITVDSDIRDFDNKKLAANLGIKKGDWYGAKKVETSIDSLSEAAGLFGYAFTEVNPDYSRDKEALAMGLNLHIAEAKRSYIERIDVNGNTQTQDKVIRREIRLAEGDAFNSFLVERSQDRINSLGFFQDKFEIKQTQGSSPDRVVLTADVEEKPTKELSLSAGFSSLECFIIQASIRQRNFLGTGQALCTSVNYSGFSAPYRPDKSIAIGGNISRREYNAFNVIGDQHQTIYSQLSTGFQIRSGVPLTEDAQLPSRNGLPYDEVGLGNGFEFSSRRAAGVSTLNPIKPDAICAIRSGTVYRSLSDLSRTPAALTSSPLDRG